MTTEILRREPLRLDRRIGARALPHRAGALSTGVAELIGAAVLFAVGAIGIAIRVFAHTPV